MGLDNYDRELILQNLTRSGCHSIDGHSYAFTHPAEMIYVSASVYKHHVIGSITRPGCFAMARGEKEHVIFATLISEDVKKFQSLCKIAAME